MTIGGHEFRAEAADGFVGGFLFQVNLLGFFDHCLANFCEVGSLRGQFGEAALHAFEGPEEIDCCRSSLRQRFADLGEFGAQCFDGVRRGVKNAKSGSHGCGDADGRRAANDHVADGFGDFAVIGVGVADFLGGKEALVEHDYAAVGPFDRLGNVHFLRILKDLEPRVRLRTWPRAGTACRAPTNILAEARVENESSGAEQHVSGRTGIL